jgi:hypothetical protein
VRTTIDDARNHLLVTDSRYSLIAMELSSVWFAGASSLYSAEFYRLVRRHLTDDGVYQQWVQMHHIYRPVFAALVNTLRREFEHVALFFGGGQGILVSSKQPLQWSPSRSTHTQADPAFSEMLPSGRPLTVLTDDILAMDEGLDRFIADSAREAGADLGRCASFRTTTTYFSNTKRRAATSCRGKRAKRWSKSCAVIAILRPSRRWMWTRRERLTRRGDDPD